MIFRILIDLFVLALSGHWLTDWPVFSVMVASNTAKAAEHLRLTNVSKTFDVNGGRVERNLDVPDSTATGQTPR
jgi:hypothetical protein